MKKTVFIPSLHIICIAILLCFAAGYYALAWSTPQNTPPNCVSGQPGCDAPIHVGSANQVKTGGVTLNSATTTGGRFSLNVSGSEGDIYNADQIKGYNDLRLCRSASACPNETSNADIWVTSAGNVIMLNGYVGIATSTPNHLLNVYGNIGLKNSAYINFGYTDGTGGYGFRDNAGAMQYKNSNGSWVNFIGAGMGDADWYYSGANIMYSSTTRAYVGIGTASPGSTLDVNGWAQFVSPGSGSTGGVRIVAPAGDGTSYMQFTNNARSAEWANIAVNSSKNLLLNPGGNVGIGSAAPEAKLEVQTGGGNVAGLILYNNYTGNGSVPYKGYISTSNGGCNYTDGIHIGFFNAGSAGPTCTTMPGHTMSIMKSGNVGIGGSPSADNGKLMVAGNVWLKTSGALKLAFSTDNSTDATPNVSLNAEGNDFIVGLWDGVGTHVNRMRIIGSTGNVGIGTAAPSAKLEIAGTGGTALRLSSGGDLQISAQVSGADTTMWNDTGILGINTPIDVGANSATGYVYFGNRGYYIGDDGGGSDIQTNAPNMYVYDGSWKRLLREGDTLNLGYTVISNYVWGTSCVALCPAGTRVLGGGCRTSEGTPLTESWMGGGDRWVCSSWPTPTDLYAYAICAKIM